MPNQNPEQIARDEIDTLLTACGWIIQSKKAINLNAGSGVAVREYSTDIGPADYILFVDGKPLGVVEAKPEDQGVHLTQVEDQSAGYAAAKLKYLNNDPLPLLLEVAGGQVVRKTSMTLQGYLNEWLESIVKTRVREATYSSYKYHLDHYLDSRLGQKNISKVTTFEIQGFYNQLRSKYSPRTVQYIHAILKNALKKAVEIRLIPDNPCAYAELPKKVKREISVFSPDEARRFLAAAAKNERGLIFEFALLTGARPEEYLALKWSDLDGHRQTVSFKRTLIWRQGGGWYFDEEMKTAQSRRTIPLPSVLFDKLKAHRVKQAAEMMQLGSEYERYDLIFANEFGRPLNYGNITKRNFQPILEAAGLGHYRLYSLRHSCATLLLAQGENIKVIQERLGHSDVVLTLSTYSHVLEGMQAQASDRLGNLLYSQQAAGQST